jgi:hypothetical protein
LQPKVLDFAAPVAAEGVNLKNWSNFEEALEHLNGITDNLDAASDPRFRNGSRTRQLFESSEHFSRDKRLARIGTRSS